MNGAAGEAMLAAIQARGEGLSGNDRDFFRRVWATEPGIYRARIGAIGFVGLGDILDAGCGFGQWAVPLAAANRRVDALDVAQPSARTVAGIAADAGIANLAATRGIVEAMPYAGASFDGIFCYSVLQYTDFRRAVGEFARVLKRGGRLYLSTNGLGWYLHNLIDGHNGTRSFDDRGMAVSALANSIAHFCGGTRDPGQPLVLPSAMVRTLLEQNGFAVLQVAGEGRIGLADGEPASFFEATYHGAEGVYEILAQRVG